MSACGLGPQQDGVNTVHLYSSPSGQLVRRLIGMQQFLKGAMCVVPKYGLACILLLIKQAMHAGSFAKASRPLNVSVLCS